MADRLLRGSLPREEALKNRLCTIATPEIIYDCWPMLENQRRYAEARGYEHRVTRDLFWPRLPASWSKVHEIHQALLDDCDIVIWADADVVFMDHAVQLGDLVGGGTFLAGYQQQNWKQYPYMCFGLTVWRNGPEAMRYIEALIDCIENGDPYIIPGKRIDVATIGKPWEQYSADELNRFLVKDYAGIRFCTADEIGCFSKELWNDGVIWRPGMPTVHFAGDNSWADRRQTFIDHYAHLVKGA